MSQNYPWADTEDAVGLRLSEYVSFDIVPPYRTRAQFVYSVLCRLPLHGCVRARMIGDILLMRSSRPTVENMPSPINAYKKQIDHIRKLWKRKGKGRHLFGVERAFLLVVACLLLIQPSTFLRWLGGLKGVRGRKMTIEAYAIGKPLFLFAILALGWGTCGTSGVLATVFLVDLFLYLVGIVFLRDFYTSPISYGRSMLLLAVNFAEIILGFAILYVYTASIGNTSEPGEILSDWLGVVYFSVVTSTTLGFGDFSPITQTGRLLVILQVLSSVMFIAVVLSTFVNTVTYEKKGGKS